MWVGLTDVALHSYPRDLYSSIGRRFYVEDTFFLIFEIYPIQKRGREVFIYICTRESIYSYNDISIENNIDVAKSSRKDKKSKKFRLVKLI